MNLARVTGEEWESVSHAAYMPQQDSYQCDECGVVAPFVSDAQRYVVKMNGFGLCIRCFKDASRSAAKNALLEYERSHD